VVGNDAHRLPGARDALLQVGHVARQQADAVRVVAEQVGLDQGVRHCGCFTAAAAGGSKGRRARRAEHGGVDLKRFGDWPHGGIPSS
jgi:hypothetical protein